jgi:conjugal transfer pilus assembly protein TraE
MNSDVHTVSLRYLIFQRNAFLALTAVLSVAVTIVSAFLFVKSERIVIAPAVIEKEFWVDSHGVSVTYLEQFGYFLGELLLSKSSQSAATQRAIIMRHTAPGYSTQLNKKLLEEEQRLEKEMAAYVFFPTEVHADISSKEVVLTGHRTLYVSGKAVSHAVESYVLHFIFQGSRLLLSSVTEKEGA